MFCENQFYGKIDSWHVGGVLLVANVYLRLLAQLCQGGNLPYGLIG